MKMSDAMIKAIEFIKENNNTLDYYLGGFWAKENAKMKPLHNGSKIIGYVPENYICTNTIKALERRNLIIYVDWKKNQYGFCYPVKLKAS